MKLTKYRLNKILLSNGKQTRKKRNNNSVNKLLTHNTSRRSKKGFNLKSVTLRHY